MLEAILDTDEFFFVISFIVSGYISSTISRKHIPISNDHNTNFKQFISYLFFGTINIFIIAPPLDCIFDKMGISITEKGLFLFILFCSVVSGFIFGGLNTLLQSGRIFKTWDKPIGTAWSNFMNNNNGSYVRIKLKSGEIKWGCLSTGKLNYVSSSFEDNPDIMIQEFKPIADDAHSLDTYIWIPKSEIMYFETFDFYPDDRIKEDMDEKQHRESSK